MARTAKKTPGAPGTGGDGVSGTDSSDSLAFRDVKVGNAAGADGTQAQAGQDKKAKLPEGAPTKDSCLQLLRLFEQSEEASATSRNLGLKARRYVNNEQWTRDELRELESRGQPPSMHQKIKPKIDYLTGLEIKRRTQPKVFPRIPIYQEDADAATAKLRYECDRTEFNQTKSEVWDEMLVEGGPTGALITVEIKNGKPKYNITHTPWDRVFVDPHSRRRDFSDARYKGIVIWMDKDDAQATWPKRADAIVATVGSANGAGITYDDRPQWLRWVDPRRQRVRIIEIYYKLGTTWWQATLTEGGYLVDPAEVVYVDQEADTECPLELISNYRKQDNSCFGVVEELIPLQDEINKRYSKFLHQTTMRQARVSRKANQGQKIKQELAKPDGTIVADKDEFEILQNNDQAEGQFKLLMYDVQAMDQQTANAALTGTQTDAPSGRAILANQQGGQVQQETPLDRLRIWQVRVFTQLWNRIRQYSTAEEWVCITGDPRNMRWVGINLPMTQADKLAREKGRPLTEHEIARLDGQEGRPSAYEVVPSGQVDENGEPIPLLKHSPADIMANIIIDEGPDTVTMQQEQFQGLLQLPPNVQMAIPPIVYIEASSLPNKDKLIEMMKTGGGMAPPGMPGAPQQGGPQGPQPARGGPSPGALAAASGPGGPAPQPGLGGAPMPAQGPGSMGGPQAPPMALPPGAQPAVGPHPPLDAQGNPIPPPLALPLDPSQMPEPHGPEHVLQAVEADRGHELALKEHEHKSAESDHKRKMEGRKQTLSERQHDLAELQFHQQNPHAQQIAAMLGALGQGSDMDGQATPGMVLAQSIGQLAKFVPALLDIFAAPTELVYDDKGDVVQSRKLGLQAIATGTLADMAQPIQGQTPLEVLAQAAQRIVQSIATTIPAIAGPKTITQGPGGRPDEIVADTGGGAAPPPDNANTPPPQDLAA